MQVNSIKVGILIKNGLSIKNPGAKSTLVKELIAKEKRLANSFDSFLK